MERGLRREQSAVTVVAAEGTQNINTHAKTADELLRIFADALQRPAGNDYQVGGEPWLVLSPWHAQILKAAGLTKAEVKRRLWEESKMPGEAGWPWKTGSIRRLQGAATSALLRLIRCCLFLRRPSASAS